MYIVFFFILVFFFIFVVVAVASTSSSSSFHFAISPLLLRFEKNNTCMLCWLVVRLNSVSLSMLIEQFSIEQDESTSNQQHNVPNKRLHKLLFKAYHFRRIVDCNLRFIIIQPLDMHSVRHFDYSKIVFDRVCCSVFSSTFDIIIPIGMIYFHLVYNRWHWMWCIAKANFRTDTSYERWQSDSSHWLRYE